MKILSLTYEYPPLGGGGSVVAAALNETLFYFGDEVQVVTSGMRGLPIEECVQGVQVHRAACLRWHRHYTTEAELATTLWPTYRRAAAVIREFRPDLIHTHFAVPSGLVARELSRRFDLPYVLTAHGSDVPGYNPDRFRIAHRFLPPLWRRVMRQASAITSPSRFLAGLIGEHIDVPVEVIPNGYSPAPRQGRAKRNLVLAVARLFPRKGIQYLIEATRNLQSDWDFVIAGDGPYMHSLRRQAARAHSPVRFVGFLDKATLRTFYEEARIMVFPSVRENFPMVLLEGMDAGCAIVSTDADGCAEVVGDTGITVKRGDPAEIRAVLQELMRDPQRCATLARAARERVRQFRWPVVADRFRHLYGRVLGRDIDKPPGIDDLTATGLFTRPQLMS